MGCLGDAFRSYRNTTGRRHEEDQWDYKVPAAGRYILEWFWELHNGRAISQASCLPLSSLEIQARSQLRRVTLHISELDAIRQLDAKFLAVMSEKP